MATLDSGRIRAEFPGLEGCAYLSSASMGLPPRGATEAVRRHAALLGRGPAGRLWAEHYDEIEATVASARRETAALLGAREDEIALVTDTSSGLHHAIDAIPFEPGDNVLVSDLEYPQVAIAVENAVRNDRVEIRWVRHRSGNLSIDDYAAAIDARTRAIFASSVHWVTGRRMDLGALSSLAREKDVFLVVDAIQELGVLPIDLSRLGVDFLASGSYKWLNAPFGVGLLYVSRRAHERGLRVRRVGLLGLEPPEGGWGEFYGSPDVRPLPESRPVASAARFDAQGTPDWLGCAGLAAAVAYLRSVGPAAAAERALDLGDRLIAGLDERGLELVSPRERSERAGIVAFTLGEGPLRDIELRNFLESRGVYLTARFCSGVGGARAAVHYYNDETDLAALFDGIDAFRRAAA